MNKIQIKLIVLFDGNFWIGIFERIIDDKLEVAKYTFGSEPKEIEIYNFILNNYNQLNFSNPLSIVKKDSNNINPKRMKRLVKKQANDFIGKKSWQALKIQQEENKINRKQNFKIKKEQLILKKIEIKAIKRLKKHKGR